MTRRTGRAWLGAQESKRPAPLRKDADESVVPLNATNTFAVGSGSPSLPDPGPRTPDPSPMKKFEIELDPNKIESLASVVKRYIEAVFEEFDGNKAKTAEALGIGRTTIYRKLGLRKD